MGRLERGTADYAVKIAEVEPVPDEMRAAQDAYAHTFVLQDTYLSALTAALKDRAFDELPHFQNEQRAAIIAWRTRLQVLADRWGATLPANLQIAGAERSPRPRPATEPRRTPKTGNEGRLDRSRPVRRAVLASYRPTGDGNPPTGPSSVPVLMFDVSSHTGAGEKIPRPAPHPPTCAEGADFGRGGG